MKHVSLIALILALGTGVALAQECPAGCEVSKGAPKASLSVTARLEKLQAGAEKGCQTSKNLLATLQKEFKADSTAALIKMVSACEQYAGAGCEVSKQVLVKINGELAAARSKPVALSARLTRLDQGCAKGCEKSRTLMASLVKQYEVKDATALVALVKDWETKAGNGCKACVGKLSTLTAKLPSKRPALSVRLAHLDRGCAKGCEKSKATMAALVKEYKAADGKALISTVQSWETKAKAGCKECETKLATLSARLAPAKVAAKLTPAKAETAAATKSDDAQCTGCKDRGGNCTGCPGK